MATLTGCVAAASSGCVAAPPSAAAPRPVATTKTADDDAGLAPRIERLVAQVGEADYLIVGAGAHRAAFAPLLSHRRAQGHQVAYLAIDDLRGDEEADSRVRERLGAVIAALQAGPLRYVLLAGDVDGAAAIPTFDDHDPVLDSPFVSDHPYAQPHMRPLALGRLPIHRATEVEAFVRKVVAYETSEEGGRWQRRLSLFAGSADFGPIVDRLIESHARQLLDERLSYDWDVNVLFSREGSPYASRFDGLDVVIGDELEQGALLAVYVGHGYEYGFASASFRQFSFPSLGAYSAEALAIERGRPLFLSLSCLTGDFTAAGRSLAEVLVLNPAGPVAVFAASGRSHPYANALFAESLLDAFFEARTPTVGDGVVAAAEGMMRADLPVAQLFVGPEEAKAIKASNRRMYHLLGDPATRPRYPDRLEVTVDGVARPGRSLGLRVAGVPDGTLLEVTLETRRSVIKPSRPGTPDLETLGLWEAQTILDEQRARTLDKTVARLQGAAPVVDAFRLPPDLAPGRYYLKILARGVGAAVGHVAIDVP